MKLSNPILKILNKKYASLSLVEAKYKQIDLIFKTDESGHPVLLFLGKKDQKGQIKGSRYSRQLKIGEDGRIIKDHWDLKGEATP